jgi:hypothetical protein
MVRRGRLRVMRLQWRQRMRLRNRILRLHRVLWHVHARDGSRRHGRGAWWQAGGWRTGRVRSGIHCGQEERSYRKRKKFHDNSIIKPALRINFFFFEAKEAPCLKIFLRTEERQTVGSHGVHGITQVDSTRREKRKKEMLN